MEEKKSEKIFRRGDIAGYLPPHPPGVPPVYGSNITHIISTNQPNNTQSPNKLHKPPHQTQEPHQTHSFNLHPLQIYITS